MEHSFVEAIDAGKKIYYVNLGGGHVCKKIVLSAVAALLMAAEAGVSILILHKVGEKRFSAIEP